MAGQVRRAVAKANKRLTVQLAASLLALSTLVTALLGIFRDRLLNSAYLPDKAAGLAGYPVGLDAYTVAFIVPDFMFYLLVSGALSVTFIPVFNQYLERKNKQEAWEIGTSMINFMALVTMAASVLIIIFADPLVRYLIAPGLSESGTALAVSMMRVIAVNPFLFAISTVITSMQQAIGRFTFTALAPAIYNVGIIIGVTVFTNGITIFGWEVFQGGIMGVAIGVVFGAVIQLIVSSIGLAGLGFDYRFKIYWKNKGFRKVLKLLPARSVDQGMDYAVSLVETNLASRMADGTIRIYQQALTLHMMPINLIGISISNAAYPRLTEDLAKERYDRFRRRFQRILRVIVWIILPVTAITFFARAYVVHFIKNGGYEPISDLLGALVIAILFRSIYHIAARCFYANQDTKTPFYVSIIAISLNVMLAVWFTQILNYGAEGLAWAQSIVAVIEVVILMIIMSRRFPGVIDHSLMDGLFRMVSATGIMSIVTYASVLAFPVRSTDLSFWSVFPKFCLIVAISFAVYLAISKLFGLSESKPVIARIQKILFSTTGR